MSFAANVVKVMIASPGDVADERRAIREILGEWNNIHAEDRGLVLMPVGWETHSSPTMGERPQAIINKQILANCDLVIAVFWTRLGSPTGEASSGTVEEIQEHLKAGKPAMLYFSSAPVRLDSVDAGQYRALAAFKNDCLGRGLVETYDSITEFKTKLSRQLAQTIIREFAALQKNDTNDTTTFSASRGEQPLVRDSLSDDAKELLLAAATSDGRISHDRDRRGTDIVAGGREFIVQQTPREVARWEYALRELESHDLIEARGVNGSLFKVTYRGHQVADEVLKAKKQREASTT